MSQPATTSVVITDSSVIVNLCHTGRIELLGTTRRDHESCKGPFWTRLSMMEHWAEPLFPRPEELGIYADLAQTLGSGEAACLALALQRGWLVACDERRAFLREARNRLGDGRILNTAGIYVLSVRQGLLTVEQGTPRSTASREHREASDSGPLPRVSTTGQTTAVQNGSGS